MRQSIKLQRSSIALYGITVLLFLIFFLYMGISENVAVYRAEDTHTYTTVTEYSMELLEDAAAPAGVRKLYRFTLNEEHAKESFLCFYVSHHHVQVFFGDTLVYSLSGSETNRIGGSVSSNWCEVHVGQEHTGQEVTIILTPLFDSVIESTPEFLIGSHYAIVLELLMQDLPQLFLSVLCILLGLFIMAVHLFFVYYVKNATWNSFYLGCFSCTLGLWRITDIRSAPLLFAGNPMVLGYMTIGALFLLSISLLLYLGTLFGETARRPLLLLACVASLVCLAVLGMQVAGIADFKESLTLSHILLIVSICSVPAIVLLNRKKHPRMSFHSWRLLWLLCLGIVLDLIVFYITKSSSYVVCTIVTFVIYALIIFVSNMVDSTRKAYTDPRTGLGNKARWNDLLHDSSPVPEAIGIMMLDLNDLKRVNDTLGHEAGDRLIFDFSNLLRNTLPSNSLICRWGGDEFTAMITGMTRENMDQQVDRLRTAADLYNAVCADSPIYFAAGYALSTDYPGLCTRELFDLADSQMYLDKQKWYSALGSHR